MKISEELEFFLSVIIPFLMSIGLLFALNRALNFTKSSFNYLDVPSTSKDLEKDVSSQQKIVDEEELFIQKIIFFSLASVILIGIILAAITIWRFCFRTPKTIEQAIYEQAFEMEKQYKTLTNDYRTYKQYDSNKPINIFENSLGNNIESLENIIEQPSVESSLQLISDSQELKKEINKEKLKTLKTGIEIINTDISQQNSQVQFIEAAEEEDINNKPNQLRRHQKNVRGRNYQIAFFYDEQTEEYTDNKRRLEDGGFDKNYFQKGQMSCYGISQTQEENFRHHFETEYAQQQKKRNMSLKDPKLSEDKDDNAYNQKIFTKRKLMATNELMEQNKLLDLKAKSLNTQVIRYNEHEKKKDSDYRIACSRSTYINKVHSQKNDDELNKNEKQLKYNMKCFLIKTMLKIMIDVDEERLEEDAKDFDVFLKMKEKGGTTIGFLKNLLNSDKTKLRRQQEKKITDSHERQEFFSTLVLKGIRFVLCQIADMHNISLKVLLKNTGGNPVFTSNTHNIQKRYRLFGEIINKLYKRLDLAQINIEKEKKKLKIH